ncbi:uncharacterized protein LOC110988057 [Acanthaster planci]|uniref:Uncharacterized protein LOC110988057 n=1 Tax=Acanthaster planci TaxID=133434 RepID=A0A8B7ZNG7_ACAPL|nr:uncharacterized protein LOC110988057 [Acanthaster planci]
MIWLKELQCKPNSVSDLSILVFRKECMKGICNIIKKVQEKSPMKYSTVVQMACSNPNDMYMYKEPELCTKKMKYQVQRFLQDKHLARGVSVGDVILQQFEKLLSLESRTEHFQSFQPPNKRLDEFLHEVVSQPHPELWA